MNVHPVVPPTTQSDLHDPTLFTQHVDVSDRLVNQCPVISADSARLLRQFAAYYHQRSLGTSHEESMYTALNLYYDDPDIEA